MIEDKYTVERVVQVWDDANGSRVEFKQDSDSLGLWIIRYVGSDGEASPEITLRPKEARLLFTEALAEMDRFEASETKDASGT